MAHTGTMNTRGFALLGLVLTACAGSHSDHDAAAGKSGAGAPFSTDNPAGRGAAGREAAGSGAAGSDMLCKRTPANHRVEAQMCDRERYPGSPASPMEPTTGCTSDADCTQRENGRCGPNNRGVRTCNYDECFADADCKQGGPCVCAKDGFGPNRCLMGDCQTDADCGANGYCSPSFGSCGNYSGVVAYYCHSCEDECLDDGDCSKQGGGYCAYEPTAGHWKCSVSQCVG